MQESLEKFLEGFLKKVLMNPAEGIPERTPGGILKESQRKFPKESWPKFLEHYWMRFLR